MQTLLLRGSFNLASAMNQLLVSQNDLLSIDASTERKQVLYRIAHQANEALHGHHSVVMPYDPITDSFLLKEFTPAGATEALDFEWKTPRPYPKGSARWVLHEGEAIVENYDLEKDKFPFLGGLDGAFRDIAPIKAFIGLRLPTPKDYVGVLFVNFAKPHKFRPEEILYARFVAAQAGIAIQNARLWESTKEHERFNEALRNVAAVLNSSLDISSLLKQILSTVNQVVEHKAANIMLVNDIRAQIVGRHGYGRDELGTYSNPIEIDLDTMPVLKGIVENQKARIVSDTATVSDWIFRPESPWVRSYVGVPIISRDQVLGILNLDSDRVNSFGTEDAERLKSFADQTGIAIRNAQLFERERRYADRLGNLLTIATDLTSSLREREQILRTTMVRTVELLGATRAAIVLYRETGAEVIAAYDLREPQDPAGVGTLAEDSPLQQQIRRTEESVLVRDVEGQSILTEQERQRFMGLGLKSMMFVPLRATGRVLGHLAVSESAYLRTFEQDEQEIAKILAGLAAVAIDNADLYGVAEKERNLVIETSHKLITKALEPEVTLQEFLSYVLQETLSLLDFDAGWLLRIEGNEIRVIATDGSHVDDIDRRFRIDDCVSGLAALKGASIYVPDLANAEEQYKKVYKAPTGKPIHGSELVVPLKVGDNAIGAFNIESDEINAFKERDFVILNLLSAYVAIAIQLVQSRSEAAALRNASLDLAQETDLSKLIKPVGDNLINLIFRPQFLGKSRVAKETEFTSRENEFGQVLLLKGDQGPLEVVYTTNPVPQGRQTPHDLGMPVEIHRSISGLAVSSKLPIIVPDVLKPEYYSVRFVETTSGRKEELVPGHTGAVRYRRALGIERQAIRAELAIPIRKKHNIVGVLNLETTRESGFDDTQQNDLRTMLEREEEFLAEAIAEVDYMKLGAILAKARALTNTESGQILRRDGMDLVIEVTTGSEKRGTHVPISNSVTGRSVRENRWDYVPEVGKDPEYQSYLGEEIKSELAVPMLVGDRVIGVLNVESPILSFFTLQHASLLEGYASQAAIAIDHAQQFEIQKAQRISLISRNIVHDLNTPFGGISGTLEQLEEEPFFPELEKQYPALIEYLQDLKQMNAKAKAITQRYRREFLEQPRPVSLKSALEDAESRARDLAAKSLRLPDNIEIECVGLDLDFQVMADPYLSGIFWNLFDNSRKAMRDGGTINISVTSDKSTVTVRIQDHGTGIEPWRLDTIFEPSASEAEDKYGLVHNLGLGTTKRRVEGYGGSLEVESEWGHGTTVVITLKRALEPLENQEVLR